MGLFGSSGIRAVFDKDLLTRAFRVGLAISGRYERVIVGTDTRTSRDAMKHAVISGLLAAGAECYDAGITPTPTLAYATRQFDVGVMITASHNPPEYNGVKLLNPDGSSFDSLQQKETEKEILSESFEVAHWKKIKDCSVFDKAIEQHIDGILQNFPTKLAIKAVIDAGCGAASEVTPLLLERLGCEVVRINCYNSGFFPRVIEPAEENLRDLCAAVRESGADVGIAHDGDADRMMAVDDRGRFISGDKLLVILAQSLKAKEVVTTLDASMAIEEMGFQTRRTKIGDTWVSEELRKGGDFGGETSGAWIFPGLSLCPDGIYAAAQIASVASQHSISEMTDAVPVYPLKRESMSSVGVDITRLESELESLKPQSIGTLDGIKLDFGDGWILIRPSGTEPKIRLTAEAKTSARVKELHEGGLQAIRNSTDTGGKKS